MTTTSDFSVGLAHKVCKAWYEEGGTPDQLNEFVEDRLRLHDVIAQRIQVVVRRIADWSVWKKLQIGGKTTEELLAELKQEQCVVSQWARDIMGQSAFTVAEKPHEVSLVYAKVQDLGFTEIPTTTQLFARAKELGLELCPAEVGPRLRLVLTDQPKGEWFWIAMEPITDSDGGSRVFHVGRGVDGGQRLDADYAYPDSRWHLDYEFVFCLRK